MPIDMTLAGGKAKTNPPPKSAAARARVEEAPIRMGARAEAVNGIFQLGQAALLMTNNYADAAAVGLHGPSISIELVKLAEINETIGKGIDFLIQAGPYAGIVSATLPLILQLAANHNRIPADVGIPGVVPPEVLQAQMKAEVDRQAAEAMQAARMAQEAAAEARADLDANAMANGQQDGSQSRAGAPKDVTAKRTGPPSK